MFLAALRQSAVRFCRPRRSFPGACRSGEVKFSARRF
jgi:hypothetical protein